MKLSANGTLFAKALIMAIETTPPAIDSDYFMPGVKSRQKPTMRHDDASFGDFLSMFNPLNMIPGISSLNAVATGKQPPAVSSLIGGAIFGGPLGVMMASVGLMFEAATGKGVVSNVADAVNAGGRRDQVHDYSAYYSGIANAHKPDHTRFSAWG